MPIAMAGESTERDLPLAELGERLSGLRLCEAAALEAMRRSLGRHGQMTAAVGFAEGDIPALVAGTLPQHRVTKLSPRPASAEDLAALFKAAMRYW